MHPIVGRQRHRTSRSALVAAVLAAALTAAGAAEAALGDDVASVERDQLRLQGSLRTVTTASYRLHEIQAPTGTVIREFSGPDGSVFAVSWEGPFLPNLRQLLGASYDAYLQAARSSRRGRGPLWIQLPDLVVQSSGHPRGFHGRAYLPRRVPEGVSADAIR
jgi:hypothetical protein